MSSQSLLATEGPCGARHVRRRWCGRGKWRAGRGIRAGRSPRQDERTTPPTPAGRGGSKGPAASGRGPRHGGPTRFPSVAGPRRPKMQVMDGLPDGGRVTLRAAAFPWGRAAVLAAGPRSASRAGPLNGRKRARRTFVQDGQVDSEQQRGRQDSAQGHGGTERTSAASFRVRTSPVSPRWSPSARGWGSASGASSGVDRAPRRWLGDAAHGRAAAISVRRLPRIPAQAAAQRLPPARGRSGSGQSGDASRHRAMASGRASPPAAHVVPFGPVVRPGEPSPEVVDGLTGGAAASARGGPRQLRCPTGHVVRPLRKKPAQALLSAVVAAIAVLPRRARSARRRSSRRMMGPRRPLRPAPRLLSGPCWRSVPRWRGRRRELARSPPKRRPRAR